MPTDDVTNTLALSLKALRQARHWSLDKTAEITGVSKAMLGQIERGESSPTVATLWKIATGLEVSLSSFLHDVTVEGGIVVQTIQPYDPELNYEIFSIELAAGYVHLAEPHQHGVIEHVIVTKGNLEILHDDNWQLVETSQGLRFSADQAHGYRNLTASTVSFINVIHY